MARSALKRGSVVHEPDAADTACWNNSAARSAHMARTEHRVTIMGARAQQRGPRRSLKGYEASLSTWRRLVAGRLRPHLVLEHH